MTQDITTPSDGRPLVMVKGLKKSFGEHEVLSGVDFEVAAGTVTVLIGPSGSGKTTVLRSLNALERPDAGVVGIGDVSVDFAQKPGKRDLAALRAQSAMVFQAHNLFPHLSVLQNVTEGPVVVQGRPAAEVRTEAQQLWTRSVSPARPTSIPTSSPADSSSVSASPERWRSGPT